MKINTKLCDFRTTDSERLHGLLLTPPEQRSELALLLVHGVAMNFYSPPLAIFAHELAGRGYHAFVINTRGHDWISRAGNLNAFNGASYENLEDCILDLDGAFEFLASQGYRRFILFGHSLGCVKSLLYQGIRHRADIVGVISCSCPKQYYSARALDQPQFAQTMADAEQLVAQGKGEELLWAPTGDAMGIFSARTYVSKYGRHEKNDVRRYIATLGCPLLTIVGGAEHTYFQQYAQELCSAAGPGGTYKLVPGANHFYNKHQSETVEIIVRWLERVTKINV
jgi:pimeloyl-ACP methyl ester carboxylesterase